VQELKGQKAQRVHRDHRDHKVRRDPMGLLVRTERTAQMALKVMTVTMVSLLIR
tara:strand:- start:164 stop:325 length:162 start_codon:yes stop_codon:yes gene_type:complete